jgi:uncharacterized protein (DUF58 family)
MGSLRAFRQLYRLSRWLDRRFTAAGRGALYLLIAATVFGIDTSRTMGFQVFALVAALLAAGWIAAGRWRPDIAVVRRLPELATVGEPLRYRVRLELCAGRPTPPLAMLDELVERFPTREEFARAGSALHPASNFFDRRVGYPRWVALVHRLRGARISRVPVPPLRPGTREEVTVEFVPERRGVLHFRRTRLLRPDPLGLVFASLARDTPQSLIVLPRIHPVPPLRLPGYRRRQPAGLHAARQLGDSQEFFQLRDYRSGDPMRRVHWPSSARAGQLVVKETAEEYVARFGLVLDTFPADGEEAAFEAGVSVAASLAARLALGDALLDLMFVENRALLVTAGRGVASTTSLLRELAEVTPCRRQGFETLSALVRAHAGRMSACVHVFLRLDAPRRELLRALEAHGVAQLALVCGDADGATRCHGVPVHRIDPADVGGSLARLSCGSLGVPQ